MTMTSVPIASTPESAANVSGSQLVIPNRWQFVRQLSPAAVQFILEQSTVRHEKPEAIEGEHIVIYTTNNGKRAILTIGENHYLLRHCTNTTS